MLQLKTLAEKFECKTNVGGIAKTAQEAESEVRKWLAVLARCVQLQTALDVLELDRVLEVSRRSWTIIAAGSGRPGKNSWSSSRSTLSTSWTASMQS